MALAYCLAADHPGMNLERSSQVEFIKEYQQLITGFAVTLMTGMGFLWGLITRRHEKDMTQLWRVIDDHEERIRRCAPQHEIDQLFEKMDFIRQEVHDAKTQGCSHNSQTREILLNKLGDLEVRLSDKIDRFFASGNYGRRSSDGS